MWVVILFNMWVDVVNEILNEVVSFSEFCFIGGGKVVMLWCKFCVVLNVL